MRLIRYVVSLLCTFLVVLSITSVHAQQEYIRVSEYLKQHPDQTRIMQAFSERVRAPAITAAPEIQAAKPVRIAVIYPAIQSSDYWLRSTSAFEARLKALKLPYQLRTFYSRPSVDLRLQAEHLAEAIKWQPDYLVFTMDALRHRSMIERILLRGKPKLILQNVTTPLKIWQTRRPFLYVGFDHELGSNILADRIADDMQGKGQYLMLYFSRGYVSQMRGDTFVHKMMEYPNIQQVASYYTDGNRQKAYHATLNTLQEYPGLKLIYACSTDIALGALDALREKGLVGKIQINGWGGGSAELEAIQKGELDFTVMRLNDDNGVAMAEAIRLDMEQNSLQVPHIYSGDIRLIEKGMSDSQLKALQQQAFRYSNQQ
ncbi:substrate-binding domain-containing protein [Oceanospirillum beijerinckii]|uniref:substrate-binding domain-containing protein n=1 Tax=Oceanospirillum beijerinckii TaxID=64976 RepID=UPI000486E989|nr:substrate-binding domain-containing protein [Oceanospirillum beijerinckii]